MAICANCGKEIADNARFCTNCGAPVQSMLPPTQAPAAASPQDGYDPFGSNMTADTGAADPAFGTASEPSSDPYGSAAGTTASDSFGTTSDPYGSAAGTTASDSFGTTTDPFGSASGPEPAPYGAAPGDGPAYGEGAVISYTEVPRLTFIEAVKTCFMKYATFSGRARRSEYWYFALFIVICQALCSVIGNAIFGVPENGGNNMLQTVFNLAVLIPQISVFWRRMHDIGRKGTWFFLGLIPVVGWIILLAWECKDSQPGENEYGMSPKYPTV